MGIQTLGFGDPVSGWPAQLNADPLGCGLPVTLQHGDPGKRDGCG